MLSYMRGPGAALSTDTVHEALLRTAARVPDRDALVVRHQNIRLTYRALLDEVERTARGLAGLGLRAPDRVGVWSANCAEWVLLQLACARSGLVLVNVNPAYRSHELSFVLRKSRIRALFLHAADKRGSYRQILEEAQRPSRSPERAGASDAASAAALPLQHAVYFGETSWDDMLAAGTDVPPAEFSNEDVVNIQYTSGTTGSPKGVLLTHRNLVNNGCLIGQRLKMTADDRICVPVPLYHCFGCVIGTMVAVTSGAAMILPAPKFDALATLEAIEAECATAVYGVPTMFIAELEHPEFSRFDLRSLRTGMMAGAPCPIEVMRRVTGDMHCHGMTIGYGLTESSPIVTMSSVEDSLDLRVSTVGAAMPETEVKIIAPESGETVPVGGQGELCTRGYLVMKGYDEEPEATRKAIDPEDWLHSGDLAVMRRDGCFRITGRAKDMIIRGGENIYPRDVEEFLYTHPKIADVQVVGLPDARLGESVAAWVRLKTGESATEEELRDFCRGKIAHFKIPRRIRLVDEFPMTVTGKIQKFRIREIEIERHGLQTAVRTPTA
ncbi:MAG: AMP-binding protein [Bryobacteraceae bacterium]